MQFPKKIQTILFCLFFVTVSLAFGEQTVNATPPPIHKKAIEQWVETHGGPIAFYLVNYKQLNLSKGQISDLKDLQQKYIAIAHKDHVLIRKMFLGVRMRMGHYDMDSSGINSRISKIMSAKKEIFTSYVRLIDKAHHVLSREQYKMAKTLWKDRTFGFVQ